jgi:PTH1 family peptidyl-tRNA hydrolase
VIVVLAERTNAKLKRARRFIRAEVAEVRLGDERAVLAQSRTFMNNVGQAVAPLSDYYDVEPDRLLVVHDDIDLPFGKLRAQVGRGPGGHNGVSSIVQSIGSREFWRLKIGVGRPPGRQDPADYVLKRFAARERPEVDLTVQYAADVVEVFVADGGDAARQRAGEIGAGS